MGRLRVWFAEEKEKIGKIPTVKKKLEYIWQYYCLWIIGGVVLLFCLIYFPYRYFTAIKENWFFITFANTREEVGDESELWKGYVEYTGFDTSKKNVEFNDASYFDPVSGNVTGNEYYEVFVAHVETGTLDAVTMEKQSLEALGASGRLMDLRDERCSSILEKYGDRLVYAASSETDDEEYGEEPIPIGIDISDSILMTKYHIYSESCVLGIGAYTQHPDAVELFLDYIFSDNGVS